MIQPHLRHNHLKHIAANKDLRRLYWSYAICGLGTAIVSVLGPIYLYKIGYSIEWIMQYFLLTALLKIILLPFVFKLMARVGSYPTMGIGVLFLIASYLTIGTIESFHWSLLILAGTKALANAFYYPSFRVSFANDCDKTKAGKQVTQLHSIMLSLGVFAPLAGGLIATLWSVSATFIVGAALFSLAFIILLTTKRNYKPAPFFFKQVPMGIHTKDYVSNAFYSTSGLADLLAWPLLLSTIIPSYAGIGLVGTGFVFLSLVVSLWVGIIEDKKGEKKFTVVGAILSSLYSALRVLVSSAIHLVGLGIIGALSSALLASSYESRYYKNVDEKHGLEYLFAMEVANAIPWIIYFPLLIGLSTILTDQQLLYAGVLLIAPTVLGTMLIRFNKPTKISLSE